MLLYEYCVTSYSFIISWLTNQEVGVIQFILHLEDIHISLQINLFRKEFLLTKCPQNNRTNSPSDNFFLFLSKRGILRSDWKKVSSEQLHDVTAVTS